MVIRTGNTCVNYNFSEVTYVTVHRVKHEVPLNAFVEPVDAVKDCRQIGKKHTEYIVKISDVPEKDVERGKHHAHADIE